MYFGQYVTTPAGSGGHHHYPQFTDSGELVTHTDKCICHAEPRSLLNQHNCKFCPFPPDRNHSCQLLHYRGCVSTRGHEPQSALTSSVTASFPKAENVICAEVHHVCPSGERLAWPPAPLQAGIKAGTDLSSVTCTVVYYRLSFLGQISKMSHVQNHWTTANQAPDDGPQHCLPLWKETSLVKTLKSIRT